MPEQKALNKRLLLPIMLKTAFTLAFVATLFHFLDFNQLFKTLRNIRLRPLAAGLILHFIALAINAVKMKYLSGRSAPSYLFLLKINFMKIFFNNSLPSSMAGEASRIYFLGARNGSFGRSAGIVVFDRVASQAALIMLVFVALWIRNPLGFSPVVNRIVLILCLILVGMLLRLLLRMLKGFSLKRAQSLLKIPKGISPKQETDFRDYFAALSRDGGILFLAVALSLLGQLVWIAKVECSVRSLGGSISFTALPVALEFGALLSALPVALAGFGLNEGAFAFVFEVMGASGELGFSTALVQRLTSLVPAVIGWFLYLLPTASVSAQTGISGEEATSN